MNIQSSKILGGIGALLLFLGVFPVLNSFGIILIIGAILVLFSLYNFASFYKDQGIFNNALFGALSAIIGVIVAGAVAAVAVLSSLRDFLYDIFPDWSGNWADFSNIDPNGIDVNNFDLSTLWRFAGSIVLVFVIVLIFTIITAIFIRRSLGKLATQSGTKLFANAGLLLIIGAALTILFGLGLILVWISALILAIAFFTMREPEQIPSSSVISPP